MFRNRTLITGIGIGLIVGAVLLKLFDIGASTGPGSDWDEKQFMQQAEEHGLQVHSKSEKLFTEADMEAIRKAADGGKASTAPSPAGSATPNPSAAATPTPKASAPAAPSASTAAAPSASAASVPASPGGTASVTTPNASSAASPNAALSSAPGISSPAPAQVAAAPIIVTIPEGLISMEIVALLQKAGVVVDGSQLDAAIRKRESTTKIFSGTYSFAPNTGVDQIVDMLTTR